MNAASARTTAYRVIGERTHIEKLINLLENIAGQGVFEVELEYNLSMQEVEYLTKYMEYKMTKVEGKKGYYLFKW